MGFFPAMFSLLIVTVVARATGSLLRRWGQPSVMGEVLGGLILGPSVLGALAPDLSLMLLSPSAVTFLSTIAEMGILIYLFLVGLEMDLPGLRRSARSALIISQASIAFPFILGLILAFFIHHEYAPPQISEYSFALFIAISFSITAFPVLARILSESRLNRTRLGELALSCAALNDVAAWCLLAVVIGLLKSDLSLAAYTISWTLVYATLMIRFAKPLLKKYLPTIERNSERLSETSLAFVVIGLLISAVITEFIGIHALFGAFLFGAIIPHESMMAKDLNHRLQDFVRVLFLPAFFALTGMRTQVGLLTTPSQWGLCLLIVLLATIGKFLGTYIAARWTHFSKRDGLILGTLMNTRGLVELIVLNIGISLGVLTPTLFTMLVIMAIMTTFATGPALNFLLKDRKIL